MKDQPSHKDFATVGDEALEARIVAWLLGESSAFEAAEIEALCEKNPEVALFVRRMRMLDGLIRDRADDSWRLPEEKRVKVLELIGEEKPGDVVPTKPVWWRRAGRRMLPIAAVLAVVLALGFLVAPMLLQQKKFNVGKDSGILAYSAASADPADDAMVSLMDVAASEAEERGNKVLPAELLEGTPRPIVLPAASAQPSPTPEGPTFFERKAERESSKLAYRAAKPSAELKRDQARQTRGVNTTQPAAPPSSMAQKVPGAAMDSFAAASGTHRPNRLKEGAKVEEATAAAAPRVTEVENLAGAVIGERTRLGGEMAADPFAPRQEVDGRMVATDGKDYDSDPFAAAPTDQALSLSKSRELQQTAGLESKLGNQLERAEKEPRRQRPPDLVAEVSATEEPFSTFSLHVSDASFKLAAAALQRGERPDPARIRPEEFYNAFDYGDRSPSAGEPVACTTEQSAHPALSQRNLLRVAVRTGSSGRAQAVPLSLTVLLDNSGSMEREDRAEGVARAVDQLSSLLQPGDQVTVAGFSRTPRLLVDRLDGGQAAKLNGIVARTPAEGGTNLEQALILGEELAKRQFRPQAQNRIVLFTDGAANLGNADPEALNARVEGLRQHGIAFDAAGFGADGLNDRLLERLTRNGNGRYYVIDQPQEADDGFAKKLAGAFRPAAENVKVQVVFNPERVGRYKLIGFEEHRLNKEDFRDDTVDAAEMAAEEAGVALYQIEVRPEGEGEIGEVRVRFRDAGSGLMVERNWTIPYAAGAPGFDRASASLQLAGLATFAAQKLRNEPMADAVDFSELAPVIGRVAGHYAGSSRVAELLQMIETLR